MQAVRQLHIDKKNMKKSEIKKAIQIIELMQKQGLNIDLFDKNVNISIVDGVLVFDKDKCFVSAKETNELTFENVSQIAENKGFELYRVNEVGATYYRIRFNNVSIESFHTLKEVFDYFQNNCKNEPLENSEQLEDLKLSTKEIQNYALELGYKLGYNGKNYILSKANYELDYNTLKEVKEHLDQRI